MIRRTRIALQFAKAFLRTFVCPFSLTRARACSLSSRVHAELFPSCAYCFACNLVLTTEHNHLFGARRAPILNFSPMAFRSVTHCTKNIQNRLIYANADSSFKNRDLFTDLVESTLRIGYESSKLCSQHPRPQVLVSMRRVLCRVAGEQYEDNFRGWRSGTPDRIARYKLHRVLRNSKAGRNIGTEQAMKLRGYGVSMLVRAFKFGALSADATEQATCELALE